MVQNEIIVGNIGTVYSGEDAVEALATYNIYVGQVNAGSGRAEAPVAWMVNGEIELFHDPRPNWKG